MTDSIADFLTRIRNAQMARYRVVEIPASNMRKRITEILYDQGYILRYKFEDEGFHGQGTIKIALKYNPENKEPVIKDLQRISTPGLRTYKKAHDLPRIINGLGVTIVSTSQGVMTNKKANDLGIGGELVCYVY